MVTNYPTVRLRWKDDALYLDGKGRALLRIVPDATYAGMWRVKRSDGSLSDMANRTWAKDAGLTIARRELGEAQSA
jgi:hypothetical protein